MKTKPVVTRHQADDDIDQAFDTTSRKVVQTLLSRSSTITSGRYLIFRDFHYRDPRN